MGEYQDNLDSNIKDYIYFENGSKLYFPLKLINIHTQFLTNINVVILINI